MDEIRSVMIEFPLLTFGGMWTGYELASQNFAIERTRLLNATNEFRRACEWLNEQGKQKTINISMGSYGLKHLAEWPERPSGERKYISNGSLIAAAIHLGFMIRQIRGSSDVHINISLKKVRRKQKNR